MNYLSLFDKMSAPRQGSEKIVQSNGAIQIGLGFDQRIYRKNTNRKRPPAKIPFFVQFPPLEKETIRDMEWSLGRTIPASYKDFLSQANGASFFQLAFFLFGKKYAERLTLHTRSPFDLVANNTVDRPQEMPSKYFFIGHYPENNGHLIVLDHNEACHIYNQGVPFSKPEFSWPSLYDMLSSEIDRFNKNFDSNGFLINPELTFYPPNTSLPGSEKDLVPFGSHLDANSPYLPQIMGGGDSNGPFFRH